MIEPLILINVSFDFKLFLYNQGDQLEILLSVYVKVGEIS